MRGSRGKVTALRNVTCWGEGAGVFRPLTYSGLCQELSDVFVHTAYYRTKEHVTGDVPGVSQQGLAVPETSTAAD